MTGRDGRPSIEEYFTSMLALVASRATCPRRAVGAIVTDEHGRVLATGYNGVPRRVPHCDDDVPCPGRGDPPGDTSRCMAVHAETNALLQCARLDLARVIYVTCVPCFQCAKAIANTPIRRVVVLGDYSESRGADVLQMCGVEVFRLEDPNNPRAGYVRL